MKVDIRDTGVWQKVLTIEVPAEELDADYQAVIADYQKRAALPGFRKGKVPRTVLEAQFGHSLEHEVLERAVKRSYESAVRDAKLSPLSYPSIEKISFDKGKPLTFEATVEVRPEITPRDYFGLELPMGEVEVGDEEIDRAIEDLRRRAVQWIDVDRPATESDAIVVDYVRLNAKGKPIRKTEQVDAMIELGAEGLLPEFRENLRGKKAGESLQFTVAYPGDFGNEELRGRNATFAVQVKGVRERRERELDDAFAAEVAGMRDMAELRARIRLNLESEGRLKREREQDEALIDQIIERNPFELPAGMIGEYLDELLQRLNRESRELSDEESARFRSEYRPLAERRLKRDLLLDAIIRAEGVVVSEEEIDEALKGAGEGELNPPELERLLRNAAQRDRARAHLAERRALALIRDRARPKSLIVTP
ncbi:MAG TPA: trigger factor [Candidatus Eisenbacteria bacterium]